LYAKTDEDAVIAIRDCRCATRSKVVDPIDFPIAGKDAIQWILITAKGLVDRERVHNK